MANGKGLTGSTADTLQVSPGILNGIGTIDSDSLEKQQPVDQVSLGSAVCLNMLTTVH